MDHFIYDRVKYINITLNNVVQEDVPGLLGKWDTAILHVAEVCEKSIDLK